MKNFKKKRGRKRKNRKTIPLPKLNDYQLQLLQNHLDSQRHLWIPLLVELDDFFSSRVDLEWFLHDYLGYPYFTRKNLDKLLPKKRSKVHKKIQKFSQDQKVLLELVKSLAIEDPRFRETLYEILREIHNRRAKYSKEPLGTVRDEFLETLEDTVLDRYEGDLKVEDTLKKLAEYTLWKEKKEKEK